MAGWLAGWLGVVLMGWDTASAPTASVRLWAGAAVLPFVGAQMDPVAVLEALEAVGYTPDALEAVGQRIIGAEVVGVDDLVAAGLSGGDVVAVRRALDPSVSEQTHGCGCVLGQCSVCLGRGGRHQATHTQPHIHTEYRTHTHMM